MELRNSPLILKTSLSLSLLAIMFFVMDTDSLIGALSDISPISLFTAFLLISCNILISTIRIQNLVRSLSLKLTFKNIHKINIYSQIFGMFAFQAIGQMAFRATYSGRYTSRPQYFAFLTLFEKIVALFMLTILSFIGVYIVTNNIFGYGLKLDGLFIIIAAVFLAMILTYFLLLTKTQRNYSIKITRHLLKLQIGKTAFYSLIMHLLMLAAYVVLAHDLLDNISILLMLGAFSIVMLGAAIPISFAGWGLRELSSGFIFMYIGLESEIGIIIALFVGVLSLLSLGVHASVIYLFGGNREVQLQDDIPTKRERKFHFEKGLAFVVALLLPILIGVQIKVPTNQGLISLNLADPVAIVVALSFASLWFKNYLHHSIWRIKNFSIALLCFVCLILYGWTLGFLKDGISDWATYNRLFGLIAIFSYLFSGVFIVVVFKGKILNLMTRSFLLTTLLTLALYLFVSPVLHKSTLNELSWISSQFSGFMTNRNALAFMLCLFLSLALAIPSTLNKTHRSLTIGLLIGLVFLTLSRTGITCAIIITIAAFVFKFSKPKEIVIVVCSAGILLLFVYLHHEFYPSIINEISGTHVAKKISDITIGQFGVIHTERLASYVWAWDMWRESPILGSGLGAFISTHSSEFGSPLTIHNTALWIATEMGILGLILLLPLPLSIFRHIKYQNRFRYNWEDFALTLVFLTFLIFSLTHEVLYQRSFWFITGLLCANHFSIYDTKQSHVSLKGQMKQFTKLKSYVKNSFGILIIPVPNNKQEMGK